MGCLDIRMDLEGPKGKDVEEVELKCSVKVGQYVRAKQVVGEIMYTTPFTGIKAVVLGANAREHKQFQVKSACTGKVLHLSDLSEYRLSGFLGRIEPCLHRASFGGLCAVCSFRLEDEPVQLVDFGAASVGFKVNVTDAAEIEQERNSTLREQSRLILVLDLDQTLLHTVTGVMEGDGLNRFPQANFTTCLRPYLSHFLDSVKEKYEMYVYTMGTRPYAELMCSLIDPHQTYFRQRIISKDDCRSSNKSLRQLLPSDDSMVVILDDMEEVWPQCQNLVVADKFWYFGEKHEETMRFNAGNDVFLYYMSKLFLQVHHLFYSSPTSVKDILQFIQSTLLQGCTLAFTGLFPLDEPPDSQPLWRSAVSHGAICVPDLDSTVTHLVAENNGTRKTKQARKRGVVVVHRLWLVLSLLYWEKLPCELFTFPNVETLQGPELVNNQHSDSPLPEKRPRRASRELD